MHPLSAVKCLGQSLNCRDSYIVKSAEAPSAAEYQRTRCHSVDGNVPALGFQEHPPHAYLPHIMHFAVTDKPWVGERNRRFRNGVNRSFFYTIWQRHHMQLERQSLVKALP